MREVSPPRFDGRLDGDEGLELRLPGSLMFFQWFHDLRRWAADLQDARGDTPERRCGRVLIHPSDLPTRLHGARGASPQIERAPAQTEHPSATNIDDGARDPNCGVLGS